MTPKEPRPARRAVSLQDLVAQAAREVERKGGPRLQKPKERLQPLGQGTSGSARGVLEPLPVIVPEEPLWRQVQRALITRTMGYALLACAALALGVWLKQPRGGALELKLRRESANLLQPVFASFANHHGQVYAVRPSGGDRLFPRGLLLQGTALTAFQKLAYGEAAMIRIPHNELRPFIQGFAGFQPIFADGIYFRLPREGWDPALIDLTLTVRRVDENLGEVVAMICVPRDSAINY